MATKTKTQPTDPILRGIRERALAKYPGAHLKSPWPGHLDLAVNDKTFAYLSIEGEPFGVSCKLPRSNAVALVLPHVQPTPYGLGKSGWVSLKLPAGELPDVEMIEAWIDESYRAQAPKRLIAQLDAAPSAPSAARSPKSAAPARPPAKKASAKTATTKTATTKTATTKSATKKAATKKAAPKKAKRATAR